MRYHGSMVRFLKNTGRRLAKIIVAVFIVAVAVVVIPNVVEFATQQSNVKPSDEIASSRKTYDCILVLGASMLPNGQPSTVLKDRLDIAVNLYRKGVAPKIVMSGDDSRALSYDEVTNMKKYAVEQGIPSEDIFCDHAGINTYDSMYRARYVFNVESMVVVTQTYHQYRALFDASSFGIDCVGAPSDLNSYEKKLIFEIREKGARVSDMRKVIMRENATHLSEPVSLQQSGDVTTW